jgi:hypothetical protein
MRARHCDTESHIEDASPLLLNPNPVSSSTIQNAFREIDMAFALSKFLLIID